MMRRIAISKYSVRRGAAADTRADGQLDNDSQTTSHPPSAASQLPGTAAGASSKFVHFSGTLKPIWATLTAAADHSQLELRVEMGVSESIQEHISFCPLSVRNASNSVTMALTEGLPAPTTVLSQITQMVLLYSPPNILAIKYHTRKPAAQSGYPHLLHQTSQIPTAGGLGAGAGDLIEHTFQLVFADTNSFNELITSLRLYLSSKPSLANSVKIIRRDRPNAASPPNPQPTQQAMTLGARVSVQHTSSIHPNSAAAPPDPAAQRQRPATRELIDSAQLMTPANSANPGHGPPFHLPHQIQHQYSRNDMNGQAPYYQQNGSANSPLQAMPYMVQQQNTCPPHEFSNLEPSGVAYAGTNPIGALTGMAPHHAATPSAAPAYVSLPLPNQQQAPPASSLSPSIATVSAQTSSIPLPVTAQSASVPSTLVAGPSTTVYPVHDQSSSLVPMPELSIEDEMKLTEQIITSVGFFDFVQRVSKRADSYIFAR